MAHTPFCKIHDTEQYGQILVLFQTNEDEIPEVRYFVQPADLGVCSVAISFTDDEEGWDLAEAAFVKSDEEFSIKQVQPIFKMLAEEG